MICDCFIIDDEKLLADSTAEYFGLFDVKAVPRVRSRGKAFKSKLQ